MNTGWLYHRGTLLIRTPPAVGAYRNHMPMGPKFALQEAALSSNPSVDLKDLPDFE